MEVKNVKDDLCAPGFARPSCQFKNIGEYIIHNTIYLILRKLHLKNYFIAFIYNSILD